ncbi:DUF3107 domain-containing protein [Jannaschia sp. R86511]|uniref:DUF3107 domain-containing protein n=1 Tax=Jannaschia sp. R86511 TaxID=3093853 RepID=UPI0036D28E4B
MEVKIGVRNAGRELNLETSETAEQIGATVAKAIADGGVLELVDSKGRHVFVPTEALAYVETGPTEVRKVGFGTPPLSGA